MLELSDTRKRQLIDVAGFLYALSLHKYLSRDALSMQAGIQGILEFLLLNSAFACVFVAARHARRKYAPSLAILCFAAFGIFALASSWKSFNPPLSLAKGVLFFVVLGIGYLASQLGLATRLFQSIYWTYTISLTLGLALGIALPSRFPLWSIDDFTGRTRLSVFSTFPGTMGETAAYLILLSLLLFRRSHWISRLFLLLMNFAAGGKTSTALLVLLLAIELILKIKASRSLRVLALASASCVAVCSVLYVTLSNGNDLSRSLSHFSDVVYGHDVAAEAVSLDGRLALWKGSFAMLTENPFLGFGFDGARDIMVKIASWSGSSHNGFLELGLAGGLLAVCVFLIGIGGVIRACLDSDSSLRRYTLPVLVYMIIIAFTGITFNFPSYFGLFILTLLLYRSVQPTSERLLISSRSDLGLSF